MCWLVLSTKLRTNGGWYDGSFSSCLYREGLKKRFQIAALALHHVGRATQRGWEPPEGQRAARSFGLLFEVICSSCWKCSEAGSLEVHLDLPHCQLFDWIFTVCWFPWFPKDEADHCIFSYCIMKNEGHASPLSFLSKHRWHLQGTERLALEEAVLWAGAPDIFKFPRKVCSLRVQYIIFWNSVWRCYRLSDFPFWTIRFGVPWWGFHAYLVVSTAVTQH
jgi:hypothetical protein